MPDIHREHRQRLDPLVNKNMEHRAKMAHVDYSALDTKRVTITSSKFGLADLFPF